MHIFDGNYHASLLDRKIEDFMQKNPGGLKELAIIMVGEHGPSEKYVELKKKFCERMGIPCEVYRFSAGMPDKELKDHISEIVNADRVGGVIIQIPLPRESLSFLLDLIPEKKDLDVLSSGARAEFSNGQPSTMPPVVRAADYFIKYVEEINAQGKKKTEKQKTAAVVGNGFLVGQPVSTYLKDQGYEVKVIEEGSLEEALPLKEQIVVLATGTPHVITGNDVLTGTDIIDFGSTVIEGKILGDLDISKEIEHLGTISPSPGGMGPLVVRFLIMNHLGI